MTLDDFQRAKLIEWAEWLEIYGWGDMPCGIGMIADWAADVMFGCEDSFPSREQIAEVQNRATFEAI